MSDVAKLAGVGLKTVSRVVNGEGYVSAATTSSVRQAIAQLGFRPNASARSLRRGQSRTIGLVLEDIAEPVQALMAKSIEEAVFDRGRLLFTASTSRSPERERSLVQDFTARQIEGIIVIPTTSSQAYLESELENGLHAVFIDRPPVGVVADTVMSDNFGGTRTGLEHLIESGHRRIAFLTSRSDTHTGIERLAGYQAALSSGGLPFDESLVVYAALDPGVLPTRLAAMFEQADPPTALFLGSSLVSVATLKELRRIGHHPALVAFDDFPSAELLDVPLTVVSQDAAAIGRTATELLFRRLEGDTAPAQRIEIATKLIVRASSLRTEALGR